MLICPSEENTGKIIPTGLRYRETIRRRKEIPGDKKLGLNCIRRSSYSHSREGGIVHPWPLPLVSAFPPPVYSSQYTARSILFTVNVFFLRCLLMSFKKWKKGTNFVLSKVSWSNSNHDQNYTTFRKSFCSCSVSTILITVLLSPFLYNKLFLYTFLYIR